MSFVVAFFTRASSSFSAAGRSRVGPSADLSGSSGGVSNGRPDADWHDLVVLGALDATRQSLFELAEALQATLLYRRAQLAGIDRLAVLVEGELDRFAALPIDSLHEATDALATLVDRDAE